MHKRLLLISNSISQGGGYLNHCDDEIIDFLKPIDTVLFIPYALHDRDWYASLARKRFKKMSIKLFSIHNIKNKKTRSGKC